MVTNVCGHVIYHFFERRCIHLLYFTSGPVDKDFADGILNDWHLEVYNNTNDKVMIRLRIFNVTDDIPVLIGDTSHNVDEYSRRSYTLNTNACSHTIAEIQYPENSGEVLLMLYGRDINCNALPGAVFYNNQLTALTNGIILP